MSNLSKQRAVGRMQVRYVCAPCFLREEWAWGPSADAGQWLLGLGVTGCIPVSRGAKLNIFWRREFKRLAERPTDCRSERAG